MSDQADDQEADWESLHERVRAVLLRFGSEDGRAEGDFWLHDDNIGTLQHKVYVRNLKLLIPEVIAALQRLLPEYPGWEIMVAVSMGGRGQVWPTMGLTIRAHEIIDGLQRSYFPAEFRQLRYAGSRPGTERD